ncbi:MAG: hypothetical protein AAB677_02980 [Patescibacteria group bacterium]
MNKIDKFLLRLTLKERQKAQLIIARLIDRDWTGLNIKKLRGYQNLFRCREGNLRIVFESDDKNVTLIKIGNRDDTTYNF